MFSSTFLRSHSTHHVGAVLDGLLGVEGAILPRDALADHAGALVDENRWRGRGGSRRGEAPRVEEAGGGGPQQLRRAAGGGGGHGGRGAAAARALPPFSFFLPLLDSISFGFLGWCPSPSFVFGLPFWGLAIHSCRES